jgi:predicted acyltransferase
MILGLIAGEVLRDAARPAAARVRWLVGAGVIGLGSGWLLNALGICPLVKRIWTSSFTLWTGGLCLLLLALAYHVIDVRGRKRWAFPLLVIGMNSIAAYCLHELCVPFVQHTLRTHLGVGVFQLLGDAYQPLLLGGSGLVIFWLILLWMYERRIFLRI